MSEPLKCWKCGEYNCATCCTFEGIRAVDYGDEPLYECVHGRRVPWSTARKMLGLAEAPLPAREVA